MGERTELIKQSLCKAIRGKVQVDYRADGLDWQMELHYFSEGRPSSVASAIVARRDRSL